MINPSLTKGKRCFSIDFPAVPSTCSSICTFCSCFRAAAALLSARSQGRRAQLSARTWGRGGQRGGATLVRFIAAITMVKDGVINQYHGWSVCFWGMPGMLIEWWFIVINGG